MGSGTVTEFHIWHAFSPGDEIWHFRHRTTGQNIAVKSAVPGFVRVGKIGLCAEAIFVESVPDSTRRLSIVPPEIRLYDVDARAHGPCVGFVSAYSGGRGASLKRPGPVRRAISRVFSNDPMVMAIFIVVVLMLGGAIGLGTGAAFFLP